MAKTTTLIDRDKQDNKNLKRLRLVIETQQEIDLMLETVDGLRKKINGVMSYVEGTEMLPEGVTYQFGVVMDDQLYYVTKSNKDNEPSYHVRKAPHEVVVT